MLKQAFSTLRPQREHNTRICFSVQVHSYHSHNYIQMISQEDHHYIGIYNIRSINYLIRNSLLLICDCRFKLITGVWRNFFPSGFWRLKITYKMFCFATFIDNDRLSEKLFTDASVLWELLGCIYHIKIAHPSLWYSGQIFSNFIVNNTWEETKKPIDMYMYTAKPYKLQ